MLDQSTILKTLETYNIHSKKYEPTLYQNSHKIGICLDLKDSLFGYLTRAFTFNNIDELKTFLTSFFWYKNNYQKYNIHLSLDNYETKTPQLIYTYNKLPLTLNTMLNFDTLIKNEQEESQKKQLYIENIKALTTYLSNLKQKKQALKQEKNQLKTQENDLKYTLLTKLTIYYGKPKPLTKKEITLEPISPLEDTSMPKEINTKSLKELETYLKDLIITIKNEELDEKNFLNMYSNSVYKYNIKILTKQIAFVESKINAEKNFNLKGSKIHNIDEELRSFLKTDQAPAKIDVFIKENQAKIEKKYANISDLTKASFLITENPLPPLNQEQPTNNVITTLIATFKALPQDIKSNLILYNSLYKPLCNYIIENNYPSFEVITKAFDFNHYYQEVEELITNENNIHYKNQYFKQINLESLDSYLDSLYRLCQDVEKTLFKLNGPIQVFAIKSSDFYKHLTTIPTINSKYLITTNQDLLLIPFRLTIDWDNLELNLINEISLYTNKNIISETKTTTIVKYSKQDTLKNGIIITEDLILENKMTFNLSHLEGDQNG